MKKFIKKYGNLILFAFAILLCFAFLAQISAYGSDYASSVEEQAVERAESKSSEQTAIIENKLSEMKIKAELVAGQLSEQSTIEEVRNELTKLRKQDLSDFLFYVTDDGVFGEAGNDITADLGNSSVIKDCTGEETRLTQVFQYTNSAYVIGVYSPSKKNEDFKGVLLIYYQGINVSSDLKTIDLEVFAKNVDSFSLSRLTALCEAKGTILQSIMVDEFSDNILTKAEDVLTSLELTGEKKEEINDLIVNKDSGFVTFRKSVNGVVDTYAITVNSFSNTDGGLYLLNVYNLSEVFDGGYNLVNSIWSVLLGLTLMTFVLIIAVVVNRFISAKRLYRLEMINQELNCSTLAKFCHDSTTILNSKKVSKFSLVLSSFNNFGYMQEKLGDSAVKNLLVHTRNVYKYGVFQAETFGYNGEGQFYLLLNYTDRKALSVRLNGFFSKISKVEEAENDDFRVSMTFSVYEIERDIKQTIDNMLEKLKIAKTSFATQSGSVGINYYGDTLRENYVRKAEIESKMDKALKESEFHLFYQPKLNLKTKMLDGSEILVRWYDPKLNEYRKPNEFLPVFEEDGFISKVDRFVFYKACENISSRVKEHQKVYPVSVNISRVTAIEPDFIEYYVRIKQKFEIKDNFITLEFTESFAFENYEYLASTIKALHENGFLCSLDDFGTGYSSYNVLKTLDMDEIKLDKFFIDHTNNPERDRILLSSTIEMIKKMGVKVTQEGVETKEDFEAIIAMGCDVVQGYYFTKPMKYSDYREFVKLNYGI